MTSSYRSPAKRETRARAGVVESGPKGQPRRRDCFRRHGAKRVDDPARPHCLRGAVHRRAPGAGRPRECPGFLPPARSHPCSRPHRADECNATRCSCETDASSLARRELLPLRREPAATGRLGVKRVRERSTLRHGLPHPGCGSHTSRSLPDAALARTSGSRRWSRRDQRVSGQPLLRGRRRSSRSGSRRFVRSPCLDRIAR